MPRSKRINPISTPKKAHACDSCDKSYTTAGELRKHHNCHTLPFKCTCTRGFSSPNDLHRHEITCQKKKPDLYWVCTESGCDGIKQWPRKDNFKAHLDRKHPLKNNPDFIQQCQRRRRDVGQNSGQNHTAHQGEMSADANNHGSPADEQLEFENSSQFTRGLHAQAEIIPDISSHHGMKSIKSDIQSVPKERLEQRQSPRALKKKRQAQVGHGDAVTSSKDPIEMDTPPQPAPAPRQTTGTTSLSHNKIERMSALAKREIARLELAQKRAQKRAHLRAANHERAAAQAAAANISGLAVNGQQHLHEPDDIQRLNEIWARQDSLRLRTNAQDAKMNAGVKYERKTQGPFSGKLVSQGTIISIDGEDYVEYRVLKKPIPL